MNNGPDDIPGIQWRRLSKTDDRLGVNCDADGPRIGPVRLLEHRGGRWMPRPAEELNFVLGAALGARIDFTAKMSGLRAIARALDDRDLARAMVVTQFTNLPALSDIAALRRAVEAEALLKSGFDPSQPRDDHGRWTADGSTEPSDESDAFNPANVRLTQEVLFPPFIPGIDVPPLPPIPPFPGDIVPPLIGNPDLPLPRTLDNPFPNDPECEREWQNAKEFCDRLKAGKKIGRDGHRGLAPSYEQCIRGQVSERCGGFPKSRGYPGGRSGYDIMAGA